MDVFSIYLKRGSAKGIQHVKDVRTEAEAIEYCDQNPKTFYRKNFVKTPKFN